MKYTKKWVNEYNKTWYFSLWFKWQKVPNNLVSASPVYIFGKRLPFWICKLGKKNYKRRWRGL